LLTEAISNSTPVLYPLEIVRPNNERQRTEVLLETFSRKQLRLKAHTVTKVEETDEFMIVWNDRLGKRLLRCGVCRQRCREVHSVEKGAGLARPVAAEQMPKQGAPEVSEASRVPLSDEYGERAAPVHRTLVLPTS
jgi:hypothetical protein